MVDSASTDGTAELVHKWPQSPVPVRLLRSAQPGKGRAVRQGLLATRAPFVGYCDADMATELSALDVVVALLTSGNAMVVGSRAAAGSVVQDRHSAIRRVGAAAFRALARQIIPDATDTQCGFKFFSGPLARAAALPLRTAGFAFDIELLANCQRLGAQIFEIPVSWRDVPGSTFSVAHHSAVTFWETAAIWRRHRPAAVHRMPAAVAAPELPVIAPAFPAAAPDLPAASTA